MELRRKLFHIAFGVLVLSLAIFLDPEYAIAFTFLSLLMGLLILDRKLRRLKVPLADELLELFGRPGEPPGYGAFWFIFGLLALLTFIIKREDMLASILMLGVGDAVSTIIGYSGRHGLPYNRNKTFEGSLAFIAVSLVSFAWLGPIAIPFALLGALVESLDARIDDNLLISLYCIAFFLILG